MDLLTGVYSISATLVLIAFCGYLLFKRRGLYLHGIATLLLFITNFIEYSEAQNRILLPVVIVNFIAFCLIAALSQANLLITSTFTGLYLASFTIYYQSPNDLSKGPVICLEQSNLFCGETLLGAGWPIQYFQDVIGVSVMGKIGIEDYFSIWSFLMDVLIFTSLVYLVRTIFNKSSAVRFLVVVVVMVAVIACASPTESVSTVNDTLPPWVGTPAVGHPPSSKKPLPQGVKNGDVVFGSDNLYYFIWENTKSRIWFLPQMTEDEILQFSNGNDTNFRLKGSLIEPGSSSHLVSIANDLYWVDTVNGIKYPLTAVILSKDDLDFILTAYGEQYFPTFR